MLIRPARVTATSAMRITNSVMLTMLSQSGSRRSSMRMTAGCTHSFTTVQPAAKNRKPFK